MISVIEKKTNNSTKKYAVVSGKEKLISVFSDSIANFTCYYNSDGEILDTLSDYLNIVSNPNTRKTKQTPLIKLYEFIQITGLSIHQISSNLGIALLLVNYIKNISYIDESLNIEFKFNSTVAPSSVKKYISEIKQYFKYLDEPTRVFDNLKNSIGRSLSIEHRRQISGFGDSTIPLPTVKAIIEQTKKESLLEYCIISLAFRYGMRIGTILSICSEDISIKYDQDTNLPIEYYLKVRNRDSNNNDQFVKNLSHEHRIKNGKVIEQEGVNVHTYSITKNIYDSLSLLNEQTKRKLTNKFKETENPKDLQRIKAITIADSLEQHSNKYLNNYLFLNSALKRLTQANWNKTHLKPIFKKFNITIDETSKLTGLNHKFRHTLVTFLKSKNIPENEIKLILKDSSDEMLQVYNNPSIEQCNMIAEKSNALLDSAFKSFNSSKKQKSILEQLEHDALELENQSIKFLKEA